MRRPRFTPRTTSLAWPAAMVWALTAGLEVEDVQSWPDVIAATTIDDVMTAAERLFTDTHTVTGYLTIPQEATQ